MLVHKHLIFKSVNRGKKQPTQTERQETHFCLKIICFFILIENV